MISSYTPRGLIGGNATEHFYNTELKLKDGFEMVQESSLFFECAKQDASKENLSVKDYLKRCADNAKGYIYSEDVYDREETKNFLKFATSNKGSFMCFLGGKSVGKSLLLRDLQKEAKSRNQRVFIINARSSGSNLEEGMFKAISDTLTERESKTWIRLVSRFRVASAVTTDVARLSTNSSPGAVSTVKDGLELWQRLEEVPSLNASIDALLMDKSLGPSPPTFVFDEANISFLEGNKKSSKSALEFLTRYTKEENKISVILATSEHLFPYRLSEMGFNVKNFNSVVYASEVPPKQISDLLKGWKVGENLSAVLRDYFAGHVYDISLALAKLELSKENFKPSNIYGVDSAGSVMRCLRKDTEKASRILSELAETGFAPVLDMEDPLVDLISQNNVGGIISESGDISGLSTNVWKEHQCEYGLVPSSHSTRLVIAELLHK